MSREGILISMTLEELETAVGLLANRVSLLETVSDAHANQIGIIDSSTPTLEEQWFSLNIPYWNSATTFGSGPRMTLMAAPLPCRIQGVDIVMEYSSIAGAAAVPASNTNYWRLVLERGLPSGSFPDMAAKTTEITGDEAGGTIYTRKTWSFDSANWNDDRDLDKGDLLCLLWQATGNPTDIRLPMTVTVRFSPR